MRPTDFALFLDLDHTIFDTESISSELLAPFLSTILKLNPHLSEQKFKVAREELWVSSLAEVSSKYCFSKESITQGLEQLGKIPLEGHIEPSEDYSFIRKLSSKRFLITTGVTQLQNSKIAALQIANDFEEVVIDDPMLAEGGKIAAFRKLMTDHQLEKEKIWVIGDNPDSEIKAGNDLGLTTVLIDRKRKYKTQENANYLIRSFRELEKLFRHPTE